MLSERLFWFLNETGEVKVPEDWNAPSKEKLWLYNLHYFDDLNATNTSERQAWHKALIARWIAENRPGQANGWEPYPLSLRIVNWIKWSLSGNALAPEWVQSLAVQIRYLRRTLEWHLLGNHLFANAKAMVFAGLFFEGDEADRWRDRGLTILASEMPEQILPDGGHFELSPMYHAIILDDVLDLINLARAFPGTIPTSTVEKWIDLTRSMRWWLSCMTHPDGQISFFNDSAFGIAQTSAELEAYGERLGLLSQDWPPDRVTHLAESGYVRVQMGDSVAILDVAPVGPDYLPGHAHGDTLSFELSLFQQRVLVNSGTSVYGAGLERIRQRSTAAHNTVEVDGESSSEVWGSFRVARRARPFDLDLGYENDDILVRCAHDGYRRLPGRVTHRREWRFGERSLTVKDLIDGRYKAAVARFHLHPDTSADYGSGARTLRLPQGQEISLEVDGGRLKTRNTTWHPEFGLSVPSQCLDITVSAPVCTTTFTW